MRRFWFALFVLGVLVVSGIDVQAASDQRAILRWISKKPVIDTIVVDGNQAFSDTRIIDQLYSRTRNFWRALRGDRRSQVQRESFGRDTLEVKYLYLTNGYLGVKVTIDYEIQQPDSSALVHVTVDEGRQFVYGPASLTGTDMQNVHIHFAKLTQRLKEGKPVNPIDVRSVVFDLKTYLANRGYPYAVTEFVLDTTEGTPRTPVRVRAVLDSLVHFGNISVEGMHDYPESVARRELRIVPGTVYRRQDIIESQRRLFESGYFTTLQLDRADNSADRLNPDFRLRVRERKPRFLETELGAVGQSNLRDLVWQTAAGAGKRNVFGSRQVDFSVRYYFSLWGDARILENRYRLRFTEPWALGFRVPLTFSVEWEPRLRVPDNDYKRRSWSITAETLFRFGNEIRQRLGIEYQSLKLSDFPIDQPITDVNRASSGRRLLFSEFRFDSRDNIFIPSRGSKAELMTNYVGGFLGGDDSFVKVEASWATFQVVWPGWILATRLKGGLVEPFGSSDTLLTEDRLLIGGASTVRGFQENRLGPLDPDGTPRGSRYTVIFNQEFRWKTVQIFNSLPLLSGLRAFPLWQSIFLDVGNGFQDKDDIKLRKLAFSYGTGIQLVSPAGPIRLDYARVIPTSQFKFDERWHFTILYAF